MQERISAAYPIPINLENCDQEPLQFIRQIQHHACLIVCQLTDLTILQCTTNTAQQLGFPHEELLGKRLEELIDPSIARLIHTTALEHGEQLANLLPIQVNFGVGGALQSSNLLAYLHQPFLLIELEPYDERTAHASFQNQLSNIIFDIQRSQQPAPLLEKTAQVVKDITGFDRVMIYQFDKDYHGEIVAEAREDHLEAFLGLHYPATDIPSQARALYLRNQVRIIVDVNQEPALLEPSLNPLTQQPTDLSSVISRGVSPIHLEYLANMGVRASMSIAVINNGQLWGLIACHHYQPKFIDFTIRNFCKLVGQVFSSHLIMASVNEYRQENLRANIVKSSLFEQMSRNWNVKEGLFDRETNVLALTEGEGAVLSLEGELHTIGKVPTEPQLQALIDWLVAREDRAIFHTDHLVSLYPAAEGFVRCGAGMMAISISDIDRDYLLWFKPEYKYTVTWGGDPNTAVQKSAGQVLSPRKSFEKWQEKVHQRAMPWKQYEIDAALALRSDITKAIIHKYDEIRKLNEQLTAAYEELESFSYSVSHDLRAPLRGIDGFAQILAEDYEHQLDDYGKKLVKTIVQSTSRMNDLINDILSFSKYGRSKIRLNELDLARIAREVWEELVVLEKDRSVVLDVSDPLPTFAGDYSMIRQLLTNLLSNAIKYTRLEENAVIKIRGNSVNHSVIFAVTDNGIGFDMKYAEEVFGVFTRLVDEKSFEGTGVGLAIAHRIMVRHGGKIWVESALNKGTTFYLEFPEVNEHERES